jgi:hypothetical protein
LEATVTWPHFAERERNLTADERRYRHKSQIWAFIGVHRRLKYSSLSKITDHVLNHGQKIVTSLA